MFPIFQIIVNWFSIKKSVIWEEVRLMIIAAVMVLSFVWWFSLIAFSVYATIFCCVDSTKGNLYGTLFGGSALGLSSFAIY